MKIFHSFFLLQLTNLIIYTLILSLSNITITFSNEKDHQKNIANAPAFDSSEDCSNINKELSVAKNAAIAACKWIEDIGSGDKNDPNSAFGKIFRHRFCKDNYVWIIEWVDHVTSKSHSSYKIMLLHPTKPALESNMNLVHLDFGHGYRVIEQELMVGKVHPEGCWIPYVWTKPGTLEQTQKMSFITRCKDKLTGKYMVAGAGIYGKHELIRNLNHPDCSVAEKPKPFNK